MSPPLSVTQFIQKNAPAGGQRSSVLEPHYGNLTKLKAEGYSLKQMQDFLAGHGIEVTRAAISTFLTRKSNGKPLKAAG